MRGRAGNLGLVALMALVAVNVWTGAPLAAIWIGSRVQGGGPPSMTAVVVVAAVLLVLCIALVRLLALLEGVYEDRTGTRRQVRRQAPWLRSMRGERSPGVREGATLTVPERVLVGAVVAGVLAFEVWFFVFAGSSIGKG